MMPNHFLTRKPSGEHGAVLITGLIFLVVLTLVVMSVMRSATLEERMSSNVRNRQLALQAAEAVLRDAEASLFASAPFNPFDPTGFTLACTNGYCNIPAAGSTPRWQTINWSATATTRSFAATTSNLDGVDSQPRYIVELMGSESAPPGKICPKILYRITARGVGTDSSAVFVQTWFRHLPATYADGSCG